MQDAVPLPLGNNTQEGMMLPQRWDICLKAAQNSTPKTSGGSVRIKLDNHNIVENPEIKPKKDYDDYTKLCNIEFTERKYLNLFIFNVY
jgi:hypothetical protein